MKAYLVGRQWIWVVILVSCAIAPLFAQGQASAREPVAGEVRLSSVRTATIPEGEPRGMGNIDRLLSVPWARAEGRETDTPRIFRDRLVSAYPSSPPQQSRAIEWGAPKKEATRREAGRSVPREQATRLASLKPMVRATTRSGGDLIDSRDTFVTAGSLAADPRSLYSRLEIEVDKAKYTITLFAYTDDDTRKVLFTTRVGLGSPEFPTPRGTFFVTRIFDDKPIWIPPDSWWAWGQVPSRSVYGGHMMPFFKKLPVKGSSIEENGEELVATRMQMIDGGGYRIHGTDSPWSVGSGQSHGCVRMLNKTVKVLADNLKMYVGTTTRGESPNGPYVNLARPVKVTLH